MRDVITGSSSSASVSGGSAIGGLVGFLGGNSRIVYSFATGDVIGTGQNVGGLVGTSAGQVIFSFASSHVTVYSSGIASAGGLIGHNDGSARNSYATGNVTVTANFASAGGLVALNTGIIDLSFAAGDIYVISTSALLGSHVGGLVGLNQPALGAVLMNNYALNRSIIYESNYGSLPNRITCGSLRPIDQNRARADILLNGVTVSSTNVNSMHGEDIPLASLLDNDWWLNSSSLHDVNWILGVAGDSRLPILIGISDSVQSPMLPASLAPPTGSFSAGAGTLANMGIVGTYHTWNNRKQPIPWVT
jgi:hypothetical protein